MIKNKNTQALTFFRFVAALIVINFHFGKNVYQWNPVFLAGGQMVTFFFVLSGFVMMVRYQDQTIIKSKYWLERFLRIAPSYYAALFFCILISKIDLLNSFNSIILLVLFFQSWVSPHPLDINPPAWSLSVEFLFYLLFPFVINNIQKIKMMGREFFWLCIILWMSTQMMEIWMLNTNRYKGYPSFSHDLIYYFPLSHLCSFFIGIAMGKFYCESKIENSSIFLISCLFSLFFIVFSINNQNEIQSNLNIFIPFESSFMAPIFGLFIYSVPKLPLKAINFLNAKILLILGNISYEMYIFQMPIWYFINKYWLIKEGENYKYCLYILLLIMFSYFFEKYIQSNFKKIGNLIFFEFFQKSK